MYTTDPGSITGSLSAGGFTAEQIQEILAMTTGPGDTTINTQQVTPGAGGQVTVPAGTELVFITIPDGVDPATVTPPAGVKVVIFQGSGGVRVVFNETPTAQQEKAGFWPVPDTSVADRVVVASAGKDNITIADSKNTLIVGVGDGDTIVAAGGNDTIVAGTGHSTISGGTGHSIVELSGYTSDYSVVVNNGHAIVTNTTTNNTFVDISKIQYVGLDNHEALIFAKDTTQAAVATMFQTVFGHAVDADSMTNWFAKADAGMTLVQIAEQLLKTPEYAALPVQNDETFINTLYLRTTGHYGDQPGINTWVSELQTHSRAEVVAAFDQIAAANLDGTMHTEQVIGSVTIVHNIV
jgi:hypothetical protein